MLGLTGGAQAVTPFETEPNDCFCEATPGGTAATTMLFGFLSDGDEDYYRFELAEAVPYLLIRPAGPDIGGNENYRPFELGLFQEIDGDFVTYTDLAICNDCWFYNDVIEVYDLPAGTYFIGVADFGGGVLASVPANTNQDPPPPQDLPGFNGLGLGNYAVSISTPEPASLALFGTALAALALRRRRR
jgi:hypothetical protein